MELDPAPDIVRELRVSLSSTTGEIGVRDVFVIAYG